MNISIMSRESIEQQASNPFPEKTAVISITDSDAPPVEFHHAPDFLLALTFDDTEPESEFLDNLLKDFPGIRNEYQLITDQQAEEIAIFAKSIYKVANQLICQCEYGQSRSAAIAAAITEYFNGNGIDIFADDRYLPNKYVFRKVIKMLRKQ